MGKDGTKQVIDCGWSGYIWRGETHTTISDAQVRQLDEVSPHALDPPSGFNQQLRDPQVQRVLER